MSMKNNSGQTFPHFKHRINGDLRNAYPTKLQAKLISFYQENTQGKTMAPEILTSEQAAGLLQMSKSYVRILAKKGELPAIQLGDDSRFIKSQLIEHLCKVATRERQGRKFEYDNRPKQAAIVTMPRGRGRPRKTDTSMRGDG